MDKLNQFAALFNGKKLANGTEVSYAGGGGTHFGMVIICSQRGICLRQAVREHTFIVATQLR